MIAKNPTIYDVARLAGVSSATVSRVLNEPSKVQPEKRKRVVDAITRLNFTPKAQAVANSRQQYKKIGVIAPFFTQPSFMQRLRGVSEILSNEHYELVLYAISSSRELDEYVDMLVSSKRVDGLIVLSMSLKQEHVDNLRHALIPVCVVEADTPEFDSVLVDNYRGGRIAAEYLFRQGCRKPAFVGEETSGEYAVPATDLRLAGFKDFFAEQGIEIKERNIWVGRTAEEDIVKGGGAILKQKHRPDCIFASSDLIAIRLMQVAKKSGVSLSRDVLIFGFDDIDMAEYVNLTTVNQGLDESGKIASELLLERLRNPNREVRNVLLPLKLVVRN